ncbi:TPA: 5'-3' exonuclease, partial [Bacillus anthracis]|nr:5'-3' exonuclease [Bacillus anthracis]
MKKVLLVDGMALLFRAFYATSVYGQFMKRQDGTPTNGIHGYMKHLL